MTKRALCVGINDYPGTGSDLSGCVNDAKDWTEVLNARGYEVTTLLDGQAKRQALVDGTHEPREHCARRRRSGVHVFGPWIVAARR